MQTIYQYNQATGYATGATAEIEDHEGVGPGGDAGPGVGGGDPAIDLKVSVGARSVEHGLGRRDELHDNSMTIGKSNSSRTADSASSRRPRTTPTSASSSTRPSAS